jgi:hypothetical protein
MTNGSSSREPGLRETPPRDVRESLVLGEQAQLDTLQDLSIHRLERWGWAVTGLAMVAFSLAILAVLVAARPRQVLSSPPVPRVTCPTPSSCPTCPSLTCPSLTCPSPLVPRRHRRHD